MTIIKVQSTSGASASVSSFAKAFTTNNTAGNLLIATGDIPDAGGGSSISDSLGNGWTFSSTKNPTTGFFSFFAYAANCASGANTVTLGNGGLNAAGWNIAIYEFSGIAITTPVDHFDSSINYFPATTTPTTTAFTATKSGALYFAALTTNTDPGSIVKDAAWRQGETPTTNRADEYVIQDTPASLAATWTTVSSRGDWFIYVFSAGPNLIIGPNLKNQFTLHPGANTSMRVHP